MYEFLSTKLASLPKRRLSMSGQQPAAVLLALTDETEPRVILTQRAMHMPTHQGQVAFPGGKVDDTDADEVATALREAEEEVALNPQQVTIVGPMGQVYSRHGFVVTPIVGVVPATVIEELTPDPGELDHVFAVPVEFFLNDTPYMRPVEMLPGHFQVPTFQYGDFTIWGMTAFVLAEFLNHVYDADFPLTTRP